MTQRSTASLPGLALVLAASLLAGCGSESSAATDLPAAPQEYDGPLYDAEARFGAAGEVVDCVHGPKAGGFESAEVYAEGATSDSVDQALETAYSEGMFLEVPKVDLAVAKTEDDRVLLTYADPTDAVRLAVIFRDGPGTEGAGGDGWYRESWARCDLSEFPTKVAESYYGYQIWNGAGGEPALTSDIVSFPGAEHCDWQSMTFLTLGGEGPRGAMYVAHPQRGLAEFFQGDYVEDMRLPGDAVATPYHRDGRRLWLSADQRTAYVGTADSVEAWPRVDPGFGCA